MPRNIAHGAKRELERTVRRLQTFCATEHYYTTAESLWAALEKNKSGAVFILFRALATTEPENRAFSNEVEKQTREPSRQLLQGGVLQLIQNFALAMHTLAP